MANKWRSFYGTLCLLILISLPVIGLAGIGDEIPKVGNLIEIPLPGNVQITAIPLVVLTTEGAGSSEKGKGKFTKPAIAVFELRTILRDEKNNVVLPEKSLIFCRVEAHEGRWFFRRGMLAITPIKSVLPNNAGEILLKGRVDQATVLDKDKKIKYHAHKVGEEWYLIATSQPSEKSDIQKKIEDAIKELKEIPGVGAPAAATADLVFYTIVLAVSKSNINLPAGAEVVFWIESASLKKPVS